MIKRKKERKEKKKRNLNAVNRTRSEICNSPKLAGTAHSNKEMNKTKMVLNKIIDTHVCSSVCTLKAMSRPLKPTNGPFLGCLFCVSE